VTLRPNRTLLHVGVSARYGTADDGMLRLRSRPEVNPSPYFVDTAEFAADSTTMVAPEIYFRRNSLLLGSEYFFQRVDDNASGDPFMHGGDVVVSWLATGETRTYNTRGGFFNQASPARTVFEGGRGAWELVGRFSYIDLEDGALSGGRFWRFTPMLNWYLSDHVRLEAAYGLGSLDRFGLVGTTQFFQSRLQLQF
jgi:phosphate-selective porin OprO/OprP